MIDTLIRAVAVGVGIGIGRQLVAPRPTPPGWYPDPWRLHTWRWWDGAWTGWTHDNPRHRAGDDRQEAT